MADSEITGVTIEAEVLATDDVNSGADGLNGPLIVGSEGADGVDVCEKADVVVKIGNSKVVVGSDVGKTSEGTGSIGMMVISSAILKLSGDTWRTLDTIVSSKSMYCGDNNLHILPTAST